jgi:hypothetical protein
LKTNSYSKEKQILLNSKETKIQYLFFVIIAEIMNINIVWITCDICVFDMCLALDKDNLNYNIYPLVVIMLHKNTFSNTV